MMLRKILLPDHCPLAYSVDEFCLLHRISRPYFYKLLKDGKGRASSSSAPGRPGIFAAADAAADFPEQKFE
jgi:hypothetical protein